MNACSTIIDEGLFLGSICILFGLFMFVLGMRSRASIHTQIHGTGFSIQAVGYFIPIAIGVIMIFAAYIISIPFCALG